MTISLCIYFKENSTKIFHSVSHIERKNTEIITNYPKIAISNENK